MSQLKPSRSRSRRFGVEFEEEKVWIGFYRRVGTPAIACEVMNLLDTDPEMKRIHLALYLRCRESLRAHKARQVRNKRIGHFVRMLLNAVFVLPVGALRRLLRHGGDIAVECLPEAPKEPANPQVERLAKKAKFSQAKSEFNRQAVEKPAQEDVDLVQEVASSSPEVTGSSQEVREVAIGALEIAGHAQASKAAKRLQRRQQRK